MVFLRRSFPRRALFCSMVFLSGCAAPASTTATAPVFTATASRTATCQGILCTPEIGESCTCAPCANSETQPLSPAQLSPTRTPRTGLNFTPPSLLSQQGMLAITVDVNGYSHIWVWPLGLPDPIKLGSGEYNDRDPAFRPDGGAIAYASQRNGSWNIFIVDLASGETQAFTDASEYEGYPSWSPDSRQLVYERYTNGHFRIGIRRVDDRSLMWAGPEGMDSFEPNWSPLARTISFTGRTGAHTDIFLLNLDTQQISNVTNTPDLDEHYSAFSPDGTSLAYAVNQNGYSWIYRIPVVGQPSRPKLIIQGDRPEWSPDSRWLAGVFQLDLLQSYLLFSPSDQQVLSPSALWLTGRIEKLSWSSVSLPDPAPEWILALSNSNPDPTSTPPAAGTPLSAELVSLDVNAPDPRLSSSVIQRFQALRTSVKRFSGWDFLATLDNAAIDIDTPMPPKETLSWLRTGRAFAISRAAVSKGWLVIVPDPAGPLDYWRLYIRTTLQDGTQGEPLRELPWDFDARTSGTPSAIDSGGQLYKQIPSGYFIDFTQLASEFGFLRIPSDPDWRTYYFGIHYWEFVCADGLDWFTAMNELYFPNAYLTPTPSKTPAR